MAPGPLHLDPHPGEERSSQELGQGGRVDPVGLHLGRADGPDGLGVGDDHLTHVGLEDPGDGQGVAGALQGHPVFREEAPGEPLRASGVATRGAFQMLPSSQMATSQKSRCTSNPMKRISLLPLANGTGKRAGERHLRIRALGTPGPVAGADT